VLKVNTAKTQYHSLYRFPLVIVEYSTKDIMCIQTSEVDNWNHPNLLIMEIFFFFSAKWSSFTKSAWTSARRTLVSQT